MIDFSTDLLPLDNPSASQRNIKIETAPLDKQHGQIRAVLTDSRVDFEDPDLQHVVHCMVIKLTVHLEKRIITDAQFATPRMAVSNVCNKLPRSADELVGLALGQGFSAKIKELYEGPILAFICIRCCNPSCLTCHKCIRGIRTFAFLMRVYPPKIFPQPCARWPNTRVILATLGRQKPAVLMWISKMKIMGPYSSVFHPEQRHAGGRIKRIAKSLQRI